LAEAARHFEGTVVARVFGRENPRRYGEFFLDPAGARILRDIAALGRRFVFGQGFANLAEAEVDVLRRRAHTITVPLPPSIYDHRGTWSGDGESAILLCPDIRASGHYAQIYAEIKRDFGDLPHTIFGGQAQPVDDDPHVLPYLSDEELMNLYASAPVFVYPSTEPRHVHYSPIEAMVVGTPVLYLRGALIDTLAGSDLPGACADVNEMRTKARALLAGDRALADAIRARQGDVVETFSTATAAHQWGQVL
jgi:glycosyltransferase involved in cell wall biosynthesis